MDRFILDSRDGEEPDEFSCCGGCGKPIYLGEYYDDHYGTLGCGERKCLLKITGTIEKIAEEEC